MFDNDVDSDVDDDGGADDDGDCDISSPEFDSLGVTESGTGSGIL